MRRSKTYDAFKAFNGLVFIVLGVLIAAQILRIVGLRFEAISGLLLGAALIALGVYRTAGILRSRK
jgi:hypothetical protein